MKVFGLELEPRHIEEIAQHGEREYPNEACGVILGPACGIDLSRVVALKNVQERYHARDPKRFPRSARDAFRIDELERMRMLEGAEKEGMVERVLYHSHANAGAYFSPEDRAMAVQDGAELMPGVVNLVVSIRDGQRREMAAFRYDPTSRSFDETQVPLLGLRTSDGLPDLEARVIERSESVRPIPPVGVGLISRRVSEAERDALHSLTAGRSATLDEAQLLDVLRLGRGYLSPLSGFMRAAEVSSVEAQGRLLVGAPWRVPISLTLKAPTVPFEPGSVVELAAPTGQPVGALGVSEVEPRPSGRVRLAGPVFVYREPSATRDGLDAADLRAEILRRGMTRVLALPKSLCVEAIAAAPLGEFEGLLTSGPLPACLEARRLPFGLAGRDVWCDAAMAQNLGATHVWVEEHGLASTVRETLQISPWAPPEPT